MTSVSPQCVCSVIPFLSLPRRPAHKFFSPPLVPYARDRPSPRFPRYSSKENKINLFINPPSLRAYALPTQLCHCYILQFLGLQRGRGGRGGGHQSWFFSLFRCQIRSIRSGKERRDHKLLDGPKRWRKERGEAFFYPDLFGIPQ